MTDIASPAKRGRFDGLNRLSPQAVFLLIAGLFGCAAALITPPLQVPDEPNHWMRVYQLSQGRWLAADHGGEIPISISETINAFEPLRFSPAAKTSPGAIEREFHRPLSRAVTRFFPFPNTALYSLVPYAPQALAMLVARKLNWPPIALLYAGRLGTLLGYLVIGWFAVRITPILQWPACMILTSPMGLFLAGALSADAITIAMAFLATALVLRCVISIERLHATTLWALTLVMIAVTLCKSAYMPLSLFVLAIDRKKWGDGGRRWILPAAIIGASLAVFLVWSMLSKPQQVREAGGDPAQQLHWIEHHPAAYAGIFCRSLVAQSPGLVYSSVGILGWLDTPLLPGLVHLYLFYLVWLSLAYDPPITLGMQPRMLAAIALLGCVALIVTANYLVWNKIGQAPIAGLQGRYFLPVSLLACLLLRRRGGYVVQPKWMLVLLAGFSIYTLWALVARYYLRMG